jgi:hypothetical protein
MSKKKSPQMGFFYSNEILDIHRDKSYENGKMSDILFNKLKNKTDASDSVKGLTILTPNINNLPFQVCWDKNRTFKYENIKLFIDCLQKPKPSWKETFIHICLCPILNLPENIKLSLNVLLFMYDTILFKLHFFFGLSIIKPPPK